MAWTAEMETASDYDAIREGLTALNGYQDSAALIEKTWYLEAKSLLEGDNPDPVSAIACLEEIPDYEGAAELARQAHYAYGKQLQAAGETATAAEQFYLAKGYEDADEQANVSYYAPAVKALEAGKFKEAARLLQNIRDYSDADDLWKQAIYQQALVEMKALDFDAATALLNQLPADYNDVATLLKDCVYQPAQIAYSRGEYEAAIAGFTAVSDYSEAADMIRLCNYDWAAKKAQDAKVNAKLNGLDNCIFWAGDVLKVIDELGEVPDLIMLDPPRDGVNPKALMKILNFGVDRLVYIACKPGFSTPGVSENTICISSVLYIPIIR